MTIRRQKIWITRAQPGADVTAERVRAMGHDALVVPLLEVQVMPDVMVDLRGVAALAFTSANGVRAFAEKSGERGLRVFAVGATTALAARKAGFKSVLSADGDVMALAHGIAERRKELAGAILHPGALELAGDLCGALEGFRMEARRLTLYQTVPAGLAAETAEMASRCESVLLHSERAAQVLALVLKANPATHMRALALSKAVLKPLSRTPMAGRAFPPLPQEAALLNLIDMSA